MSVVQELTILPNGVPMVHNMNNTCSDWMDDQSGALVPKVLAQPPSAPPPEDIGPIIGGAVGGAVGALRMANHVAIPANGLDMHAGPPQNPAVERLVDRTAPPCTEQHARVAQLAV